MRSRCIVGTFQTCIKSCKGSALKLLDLIVNDFKAYRDEAVYEGKKGSYRWITRKKSFDTVRSN